jgi:hypothetical protein
MTLEKLQLIATAAVEPEYKVRWLKWWNSGSFNREAIRFPKTPAIEDTLKPWLNKTTFWAGYVINILFCLSTLHFVIILILALNLSTTKGRCGQPDILTALGGLHGDVEVDSLTKYLEKWQICLWDKAFIGHFQGRISTERGHGGRMSKVLTTLSSA